MALPGRFATIQTIDTGPHYRDGASHLGITAKTAAAATA